MGRSPAAWLTTLGVWAAALGLALVAVLGLRWASVPVPLYVPLSGADIHTNIPRLALAPLAAGIAYGAIAAYLSRGSARQALATGVLAGLAVTLYTGLVDTAAVPFHDEYFGLAYRIYALGFVALVTAGAVAFSLRRIREGRDSWIAAAIIATAVIAAAHALLAAERLPGLAATGGLAAGFALASLRAPRSFHLPRNEMVLVVATAIAAFVLRAAFGLQALARTGPGMAFAVASDDGPSYYQNAVAIHADPGAIPAVLAQQAGFPPGYSLFLAGIFSVTGESLAAVVLAQAALAGLATALLYLLARSFAPWPAAAMAAAFYAAGLNLVQNNSTLTPESILLPMLIACFWCVLRYERTGRYCWLAVAAALLGGIYFTRNVVGVALFAAMLWWLAAYVRPWPRLLRDASSVVVAVALAVLPVLVATTIVNGKPAVTNQLAAVGYELRQEDGLTVDNAFLLERDINPLRDPLGSIERVVADPVPVVTFLVSAVPHRVATLLFHAPSGAADPVFITNPTAYDNVYGQTVELLRAVALAVAVAITIGARPWRGRPLVALLLVYVVLYVAVFALVIPPRHGFRYRIPLEPFRYVAEFSVIAYWLVAAIRSRSRRLSEDRSPAAPGIAAPRAQTAP